MKNLISILSIVGLITVSLTSCSNGGPVTTEERILAPFTGIDAGDGVNIIVTNSNTQQVIVEAPENHIQHVKTNVSNGILIIERDQLLTGFNTHINIHIHVPVIESIILSGGSELTGTNPFPGNNLVAKLSGGSKMKLQMYLNQFTCEASGGSVVNMTGNTTSMNLVSFSGGSVYKGFEFHSSDAVILASGGSNLEVRTNNTLQINASGGSSIKYKGNPIVQSNLSGGSTLINAN